MIEITGAIQRTRVNILGVIFCLLGSIDVTMAPIHSKASRNSGIPNTAKALLLKPSASLSMPKWVAIGSGRRFHSMIPIKIGRTVMILAMISVFLFAFSILLASSQVGDPEHDLLEY